MDEANHAKPLGDSSGVFMEGSIKSSGKESIRGGDSSLNNVDDNFKSDFDNLIKRIIKNELKTDLINELSKYNVKDFFLKSSDYILDEIKIIKDKENWKDKIYKLRKIKNDANSYVRSIILCYLENIILEQDLETMKKFIINFEKSEINKLDNMENNKIKIIHILVIILDYMEHENTINEAYDFLLKSFLFLTYFDSILNYYMRKTISDFISKKKDCYIMGNETKKYIELIPEKYKSDRNGHIQLLDKFNNDLLNMEYDIPYDEIYSRVISNIFECDLSIIIYNKKIDQLDECKYKYEKYNDLCLNLIYYENQKKFGIYYIQKFYKEFEKYLEKINIEYRNFILDEIDNDILVCYTNFREQTKKKSLVKSRKKEIIEETSDYLNHCKLGNETLSNIINKFGMKIEDLIYKNKQRICLVCINNINIEKNNDIITLPCKCKICSSNCLDIYMKEIDKANDKYEYKNEIMITPMSHCFCGFSYKLNEFNIFNKEIERFNNKGYKSIIEEAIKNNLIWKCIFCRTKFNKIDKFFQINIKEGNKHLLCEKCKLDKNINDGDSGFFCLYCNDNHLIQSIETASPDKADCLIM